jgi:hypothetical protein
MNTLSIHYVSGIKIRSKSIPNPTSVEDINVVDIDISQEGSKDFTISLFLNKEKKFKALDFEGLSDLIQKHGS